MSGIVVLPLLKVLIGKLNSLLVESAASIYNLKADLEGTVAALQIMAAMAHDAEQQADHSLPVKRWLERLQDVLYEADDLIDELQIMLNQVSSPSSSLPRLVKHNLLLKSKLAPPLKHIRQVLVDMEQFTAHFGRYATNSVKSVDVSQRRVFVDPKEVIGRDSDKYEVMKLILTCDVKADHKVSVVPIVGSVAIGKTTLAMLIYNDSMIDAHFHQKLWLSLVGCHDIFHFLKMLSYQLGVGNLEEDGEGIEPMKMKLYELLENKSSLIVLDDFKDDNLHKRLARELTDKLFEGSTIILITRSRKAARFIGTTPAYQLQPLSPDASYQLFACTAFSHGIEEHSEYKHIGRELVKLCSGIPLLLKVIGSLLRLNNTVTEWRRFLEIVHDHGFADIREDIRFDYIFEIPSHLKYPLQCFRLQKACGLSVETLTCVWMALGFLYSPDDRTTQPPAEYIAREYLNEFVESALWPDVEYAPGGVVRHIKFHDALYDLATSGNPWWRVVHDEKKFDGSPMYIIWDQDCLEGTLLPSDHIRDPNKVRLFLVSSSTRRQASLGFVSNVVSCFQRLRVLGLGGCDVEMLPHSIVKLKHLRYLDVGRNPRMKTLPDSICKLWHLQTLFLHGCSQLEELPAKIGRLQNLRYLTLTILKKILPDAIGQLTSLRTFGLTNCPRLTSLPSSIKNLKSLEMLAIVKCPELDLASTSSVEAFKGLDAIHTLLLSQLPKIASLPSQLGNLSATLKHLQILFCSSLTEVKWITQFRSLHSLTIEDCPLLSDLTLTDGDSQLNGLSELIIGSCPSLRYTAWIRQFVSLHTLIIDDCPELVVLDDEFSELKILRKLQIRGCPGFTKWFASLAGKDWCHNVDLEVIEIDGEGLKS